MLPGIMAVEMFPAAEAEAVAEEAVSDADAEDCSGGRWEAVRRKDALETHKDSTYRSGITNILSVCTCTDGEGEDDRVLDGKHRDLIRCG
jgi:hypothetical protein